MDGRTRSSHAAMNGRVFRVDDPIWRTHAPPNGYNCRCRLRPMSESALKREGIAWESSAGRLNEVDWPISARNPSLGTAPVTVYKAPWMDKGFAPDVGFNSNPGKDSPLWDRNGRLPDCDGTTGFADRLACLIEAPFVQKNWKDYKRPDLRDVPARTRTARPDMLSSTGADRQAAARLLADALGLSAATPLRMIETPLDPVLLRHEWLPHLVEKEADARERYANFVLPTLENPFEIWLTAYGDAYRKRYIGLFAGASDLMVIVRENTDGSLMWNIMQADDKSMNKQRLGALLYGR